MCSPALSSICAVPGADTGRKRQSEAMIAFRKHFRPQSMIFKENTDPIYLAQGAWGTGGREKDQGNGRTER